jgi:pSer/pThr/pTyr-binding forkhead associated (FHA) protein
VQATDAVPFPTRLEARTVPLTGDEVLIGRRSETDGILPQIDLGSPVPDPGVSRRHAVLRRQPDGGWAVIDQGSTNGTLVNDAATPVRPGQPAPLRDGDHVHVGAWTRITLRRGSDVAPAPSEGAP